MKKYRLKEGAKERLKGLISNEVLNMEACSSYWENETMIQNIALEEVEERIEVIRIDNNKRLQRSGNRWTEQEREDIEKFLNVFGSWEKMMFGVTFYMNVDCERDFINWLKN